MPPQDQLTRVVTDVSIVAVAVVLAIVVIVIASVYLIVRFLRGVVDGPESAASPGGAAWLAARGVAQP